MHAWHLTAQSGYQTASVVLAAVHVEATDSAALQVCAAPNPCLALLLPWLPLRADMQRFVALDFQAMPPGTKAYVIKTPLSAIDINRAIYTLELALGFIAGKPVS
jgi:hypothetical protein